MANDKVAAGGTAEAQQPLLAGATDRQVVVGDIPMEPPCFRARAGLLAELDRASARVSVIHPVAELHGLGATQLAAAYARAKLAAGWRLVAWVNGADVGSLLAGLAAVADATGLVGGDPGRGVTDAGSAVRHWLETDGEQCLLVFDDVADLEAAKLLQDRIVAALMIRFAAGPCASAAAKMDGELDALDAIHNLVVHIDGEISSAIGVVVLPADGWIDE